MSHPLTAEFNALMARAGLVVPKTQREEVIEGYAELRAQVELLRGRPATAEPSNIFALQPFKATGA